MIKRSISYLEERLPPTKFFRANRKHIINIDFVSNVEALEAGHLSLTLQNGEQIELSRRQSQVFKDMLSL